MTQDKMADVIKFFQLIREAAFERQAEEIVEKIKAMQNKPQTPQIPPRKQHLIREVEYLQNQLQIEREHQQRLREIDDLKYRVGVVPYPIIENLPDLPEYPPIEASNVEEDENVDEDFKEFEEEGGEAE